MTVSFAQISDCHLFADRQTCHHGANVYDNLVKVLTDIKNNQNIDFIVFTGDLTQDHSDGAYQLFTEAIKRYGPDKPIYYLAGNHDEPDKFCQFFTDDVFSHEKTVDLPHWQIQLINTKSATPAGVFSAEEAARLAKSITPEKYQCILMHHHPKHVGYFIDKHPLINDAFFNQFLAKYDNIQAVACGHVHNAMTLSLDVNDMPLFTCPATSIQFDKTADTVVNSYLPAGFRLFTIDQNNVLTTQAVFLS
ncbi:metallophosphoesterase [Thalassotalea sp. PP2-459]|uniref:metallophosphoesterase n=1 Tax=Thalassotalea sp. PP2-459 TaxID=1742724 RepID=UPI000941DCB7|nr:metallophosphoesterase [Thalassotalea sp. PP2-459]OKY26891.1 hypothetical protein BI291_10930 [Thalassotalea sp. PP2-459]